MGRVLNVSDGGRGREREREKQVSQVEQETVMAKGQGFEECFGVNDQIALG